MLNYVNSFSLSTSEDQTRVVIHLMQDYPSPIPEEENPAVHELVSSVILDAETAVSLASAIADSLDSENNTGNENDSSTRE